MTRPQRRPALTAISFVAGTTATIVADAETAYADPPGLGIIRDVISAPAGWAFDKIASGIASWVLGAVADLINGVVNFLKTTARPELDAAWFSGAGSPFAVIRNIAGVLLVGFVLLAVIQGLLAGDLGGMVGRIARDVCVAVLGMGAVVVVTVKLLDLTDALSTAVLGGADGQAVRFLSSFGASAHLATAGFSSVLIGIVAVLAALLVWIELMVRAALVYLLVAIAPLAFAAMTWPAAKGVLRRTVEVLIAVILSKFVICVAIAIGVAALGGAGTTAPGTGTGTAAASSLGTLLTGTAIVAMAAFSPFLVLKIIPVAEAAVLAQGVSRSPLRGAQSAMSGAYYANSLSRLAGGGAGGAGSRSAPSGGGGGPAGGGPAGGTPSGRPGGGGSAGRLAGTNPAPATAAARSSAGAAPVAAPAVGAVAGPAGLAVAATKLASAATASATRTAEQTAAPPGATPPPRRPPPADDRPDLAGRNGGPDRGKSGA